MQQRSFYRKIHCAIGLMVLLAPAFSVSRADSIGLSASQATSNGFAPSSDSIRLNASSGAFNVSVDPFVFQTGSFVIGNSNIPDQLIAFSIQDAVTIDGLTQMLTFFGEDNVTSSADTLSIFAGAPVLFGDKIFTFQGVTLTGDYIGEVPLNLAATVTQAPSLVPEAGSLLLVGTGLTGLVAVFARKGRSFRPRPQV